MTQPIDLAHGIPGHCTTLQQLHRMCEREGVSSLTVVYQESGWSCTIYKGDNMASAKGDTPGDAIEEAWDAL